MAKVSSITEQADKFVELWESLDLEAVAGAIGSGSGYVFDLEEAREAVLLASYRWLLGDLEAWRLEAAERTVVTPDTNFKFVVDLQGSFSGKGTILCQYGRDYAPKALSHYAGQSFICDWKTTGRPLNDYWQTDLLGSAQWRAYLAETGADWFIYRGIQRRSAAGEPLETKEFYIHRDYVPDLRALHVSYLGGIEAQRNALIDRQVYPWPQNLNDCKRGPCAFRADCEKGLISAIPPGNLDKGRPLSYSRLVEFTKCPERHRRAVLERMKSDEEGLSGPEAEFGKAVHRGLAEVYTQAFGLHQ